MCNCNKITICTEFDAAQIAGLQVPIASIHAFATLTVPDGYLICDGSAVSRTDYADLFAALGTVWGEGDGNTTFNIPDLRGEFLRGFDAGRGVDAGRVFASYQGQDVQAHQHRMSGYPAYGQGNGEGYTIRGDGFIETDATTYGDLVNAGGEETRPRNVAVTYAIKAAQPTSN